MNMISPTFSEGTELTANKSPRWTLWCLYQGFKREAAEVLELVSAGSTEENADSANQ